MLTPTVGIELTKSDVRRNSTILLRFTVNDNYTLHIVLLY